MSAAPSELPQYLGLLLSADFFLENQLHCNHPPKTKNYNKIKTKNKKQKTELTTKQNKTKQKPSLPVWPECVSLCVCIMSYGCS
jgi:hypothetical protein